MCIIVKLHHCDALAIRISKNISDSRLQFGEFDFPLFVMVFVHHHIDRFHEPTRYFIMILVILFDQFHLHNPLFLFEILSEILFFVFVADVVFEFDYNRNPFIVYILCHHFLIVDLVC